MSRDRQRREYFRYTLRLGSRLQQNNNPQQYPLCDSIVSVDLTGNYSAVNIYFSGRSCEMSFNRSSSSAGSKFALGPARNAQMSQLGLCAQNSRRVGTIAADAIRRSFFDGVLESPLISLYSCPLLYHSLYRLLPQLLEGRFVGTQPARCALGMGAANCSV